MSQSITTKTIQHHLSLSVKKEVVEQSLFIRETMKQKMRIKVFVKSDKCMKKAMKVAAVAKGVTSVAMEGESKDEIVVVGDGVDPIRFLNDLRKKADATLKSLEEVKGNQKKPQVEEKSITPHCCIPQCSSVSYQQPLPEKYVVVYDSYGPTTPCSIM